MIIATWVGISVLIALIVVFMAFIISACRISSRMSRLEEKEWTE